MSPGRAPVSVVVVNWNGRHHLERCLPALLAQTLSADRILVVDNGSTDGSAEWLRRLGPPVEALCLATNAGFAAGNNRGLERVRSPWVALINNDAVPDPDWLESLLAAGLSRPDLGSVASLMVFAARPHTVNSAGIAVDPAGIAWDRLGGSPVAAAAEPGEVFGASAGAALYRMAALADAGEPGPAGVPRAFDERFFMFLEDVDLAWRLRLRRWGCLYTPRARVLHVGSATARQGSAFKNRLLARNKVWTVVKDYPAAGLLARLPVVVAYDLGSAPYRLVAQGQTAALGGRLDALRGLGPALAERRAIQGRRLATWPEIAAAMSPLDPPWRVPRRYAHLGSASD